jgi:hypothetical protein
VSGTSKKLTQDTLSMAVTPSRSRRRSLPSGSQPYPRPSQWSAPRQLPANWSRFGCHLIAEYALGTAVPAPSRAAQLAAAGLALDWGPGAMALCHLRPDRLRGGRREAHELQAGAYGGQVVARFKSCIGVAPDDASAARSSCISPHAQCRRECTRLAKNRGLLI